MASSLKIVFNLGDNFEKDLLKTIENEINEALVKWKINPENIDRKLIVENSLKQVRMRANTIYDSWDLSSELSLSLNNSRGAFQVPSEEAKKSHIRIAKTATGWRVDHDRDVSSHLINDMLPLVKEELYIWAKTAAFYGVGSYKA